MTAQQFSHVLGLVESNANAYAIGDKGRALGRFQIHPDWLWDYATVPDIRPNVGEIWDAYFERVVEAFFAEFDAKAEPAREIAMRFHRGHKCAVTDDDWDKDYAARWDMWVSKLSLWDPH